MSYIGFLQEAIKQTHGVESEHIDTVAINEWFNDKPAWQGNVEIFKIRGSPLTDKCYAWGFKDDEGTMQAVAVLSVSPLDTPLNAVRGYIASEAHNAKNKA